MNYQDHCSGKMRAVQAIAGVIVLAAVVTAGCSTTPELTSEDRKKDIEFLARWARDYSPLVELNERYKGVPSYEALLPRYLEFAEQARSDEEFFNVVVGYFRVIGASGHAYLVGYDLLKWFGIGTFFGTVHLGITPNQFQQARYWVKVSDNISTRAHPPFRVVGKEGGYFTGDDWQYNGTTVPTGSEIFRVNGMTCSHYLDYIKEHTLLKYDAYSKDWADFFLMVIDEGPFFKGWQVDFRLPDGAVLAAFVPKVKGFPAPIDGGFHTVEARDNCTCIELTDDVGYIRIKNFMFGGPLDYIFKRYIKKERETIREFLEHSQGRYKKLIIDIRNNPGGNPAYFYDNLISPFLDKSVTYKHTVGLKRRFLTDTKPSVLRFLRKAVVQKNILKIEEVAPPEGFDGIEWVFFEITRKVEPSNRYKFTGNMYILINGGCYSAADDYPNTIKRTGIGTLVGQRTGGAGGIGYCMSPLVRLPASGMIFALDAHLPLNPDGSFSGLNGLEPDIKLPPADAPKSITKEDLLKDEWIKKIINEL
jgi:hypothetical protein